MYEVVVHGLEVQAHHGSTEAERESGRRFLFHLTAEVEGECPDSDDLNDTVNYAELAQIAIAAATQNRFRLVETLAATIAGDVLSRFPKVERVHVEVVKLHPPIPAVIEGTGVRMTRERRPLR